MSAVKIVECLKWKFYVCIFQMKRFSTMVKETTGINSTKERKLTMMMFCVVLLYIVANTYSIVGHILYFLHVSIETGYIFRPIHSLLWVVNSSANLFIYLYFNKTFRDSFIAIFSCNKTNPNVLNTSRLPLWITSPMIQNINVLKTSANNKDAINKTAVFYQSTNEEVL